MTNLNLLGAEHSSNEQTKFLGTEDLYSLGMNYRGCKNDSLSVIYINTSDENLEPLAIMASTMILANGTEGSKVQILTDPAEIELAYIKLSLSSKQKKEQKETKNVKAEPNKPFNINDADNVTLVVVLSSFKEELANKLLAQADLGTNPIYIITNNKEVADNFDPTTDEDEEFINKIAAAVKADDFSTFTKEEALEHPQFFTLIPKDDKEYIAFSPSDDEKDTLFFSITGEGTLERIKSE